MKRQNLEILMLKGLPASGKTTLAKSLVANLDYIRINKDELRETLHNGQWSKANERYVLAVRDDAIKGGIYSGKSVVVDDTNFAPVHEENIRKIAESLGVRFRIQTLDTPLEDCIERNEKRDKKVPVNVIYEMYNRYVEPNVDKVEYDDSLEECIVVDVDGTLAHVDSDNPRNIYDASSAIHDKVDDAVSNIVGMAYNNGYIVVILTGRSADHLDTTKEWLEVNSINYDHIYSRASGDSRKDTIVKKELYDKHIKGKYNVKYVIDDRPSVCRMWRSEGLPVFQVGNPHLEF